jgi:hypothetical protein
VSGHKAVEYRVRYQAGVVNEYDSGHVSQRYTALQPRIQTVSQALKVYRQWTREVDSDHQFQRHARLRRQWQCGLQLQAPSRTGPCSKKALCRFVWNATVVI